MSTSAFTSAFGSQGSVPGTGAGMSFGGGGGGGHGHVFGGNGGHLSGNAFGTPNSATTAFHSSTQSAFTQDQGTSNHNSINNNGFSGNIHSYPGAPSIVNSQVATFGGSGHTMNNTSSLSGGSGGGRGGGRGRGHSGYRDGRGGSGNRSSANMTYVAPGLSSSSHYQKQHQDQSSTAFSATPSGMDNGSPFSSSGSSSTRGGYSSRGRGRGGGGGGGVSSNGGVPGQFRSLQWRADGGSLQNQQSQQSQHAANSMDSSSTMPAFGGNQAQTQNMGFGGDQGGAGSGAVFTNTSAPYQSQQHSVFGSLPSSSQIRQQEALGGSPSLHAPSQQQQQQHQQQQQSMFGYSQSSSIQPPRAESHGLTAVDGGVDQSQPGRKPDSVFAVPASQSQPSSATSATFALKNPSTQQTGRPVSLLQDASTPEDADSRLARFSAVPIGNRYDELKEKRVKEREEATRKGDISDPTKRAQLKDAISFVGTCMDMCPEFERHEREYQQNVEKFEKIPGTEHIDHSRAVKAYARPAAGVEQPLPSDVRPPNVLLSTLDYLMREIVAQEDLGDSHAFIRDRTRSIRQDFTFQNSRGLDAVYAHEIIARYHILCVHQLCEKPGFTAQQEMEQLRKVLTSLDEFYDELRLEGVECPNEAEFRAYHVLSHLHETDIIRQAQLLPPHIFQDPYIQVAVEMHALTRRSNDVPLKRVVQSEASPNFFSRFFKAVDGPRVSYLMACILEASFGVIRKAALRTLNNAYADQNDGFLVRDLVDMLGFEDAEECIANCEQYNLALTQYGQPAVLFGRKDEVSRRRIFQEDTVAIRQHRNERIVEEKRSSYTTLQIIYGETPGPQQKGSSMKGVRPLAMITTNQRVRAPTKPASGLTSTGAISLRSSSTPAAATTTIFAAGASPAAAQKPSAAIALKTPTVFGFGMGEPLRTGTESSQPSLSSTSGPGLTTTRTSSQPSGLVSTSSSLLGLLPASTPVRSISLSGSRPAASSSSAQAINASPSIPTGAGSFGFSVPQSSTPTPSFVSPFGSAAESTQPPMFKVPGNSAASARPFAFGEPSQVPSVGHVPVSEPSFDPKAPKPLQPPSVAAISMPKPVAELNTSSSFRPSPSPMSSRSPVGAPLRSDGSRIVTRRGRVYDRSLVDAVMQELVERETDRFIRVTAAQVAQEAVVERSLRRAKQRQEAIRRQSESIMAGLLYQVTDDMAEEILADLYREIKLQRRVVSRWRDFTAKCRQRAEELRRRQEHFLSNVRAMGSRAGLVDGGPVASKKIRDYAARHHHQQGQGASRGLVGTTTRVNGKTSAHVVTNKRKRLLSIGQEGADRALVAGLKRLVEPKREMWAPLAVLEVVLSKYHGRLQHQHQQPQSEHQEPPVVTAGPAVAKRRWRLFVNLPSLQAMGSKWLLTKLGMDMSRSTKAQQRSGMMTVLHQHPATDKDATDVVVCGVEDKSLRDLLGMSKYTVLETAAFMVEFSGIPFAGPEASEVVIR
ncbi:hypothetical protein EDD11_008777 [Mortierella claussenii]|nr:hypothetical protein EDD11_008777 [Mortierella claussenii]